MDWIGSMGAGPPCNFTCFDITAPPLLLAQLATYAPVAICVSDTQLLWVVEWGVPVKEGESLGALVDRAEFKSV